MKTENLENLEKLVSDEISGWLDKYLYYKANKNWLDNSSKIALTVLETLDRKEISQRELAKKMNVSAQHINRIVRGKQNLTLETISKLEIALDISLLEIIDIKKVNEIKTNSVTIVAKVQKTTSNKLKGEDFVKKNFSPNFIKSINTQMTIVYSNQGKTSYQKVS